MARRGGGEDPLLDRSRRVQRSLGLGCINEQAVLEGTGCCNADEWSLQSRDEGREQKGKRGEEGGEEYSGEVGTEGAAVKKGFNLHLRFL